MEYSTTYFVIIEPPLNTGAFHSRLTSPFPRIAVRSVGALGTVNGTASRVAEYGL